MSTTMSMGIGTNTVLPDEGITKGRQHAVACYTWFTSTGRTLPKLIKYQDEEGQIQTLTNFRILHQCEKYFCGIKTLEYECELFTHFQTIPFRLLFYVEQQEWKLWWKY